MKTQSQNDNRVNWRVGEFCTAHGISRAKFYRECHAGRLTYMKSGKLTLIPRTVADKWQADRLAEAGLTDAA